MTASKRNTRPSPVFLAVLAVAVLGGVMAWTVTDARTADVGVFLLVLGGWTVTLCLHEFGHAFAAYRAGDRDVETAGYLTLNPFKYVHPVLSIALPLFFIVQGGIGLPGGAVYLHPGAFRTRAQQSITAAAGPAANVVFAVVLLEAVKSHGSGGHERFWSGLAFLGFLQVTGALLNLLPIPGLDGYAVIEPYLSPVNRQGFEPFKAWGMLAVIALLQIQQLNARFFDLVLRLYDLSGASRELYSAGYFFFRFWTRQPQ